jgi:tRNA(fMet)-specific endonuclease VapC
MSGRLAVDTNAVIAYRGGISEVCDLIEKADGIIMPVTVWGELLYGALNSARYEENELAVRKFLMQCVLIPIDDGIAYRYANTRLKLKKSGRLIPENDIWIAATCLEFDIVLLSQDNHFRNVPGLQLIEW